MMFLVPHYAPFALFISLGFWVLERVSALCTYVKKGGEFTKCRTAHVK